MNVALFTEFLIIMALVLYIAISTIIIRSIPTIELEPCECTYFKHKKFDTYYCENCKKEIVLEFG